MTTRADDNHIVFGFRIWAAPGFRPPFMVTEGISREAEDRIFQRQTPAKKHMSRPPRTSRAVRRISLCLRSRSASRVGHLFITKPARREIGGRRVNNRSDPVPASVITRTSEPVGAIQIFIVRPISTWEQRDGECRQTIPAVTGFATVRVPRNAHLFICARKKARIRNQARSIGGSAAWASRAVNRIETAVTNSGKHLHRRSTPIG